MDARTVLTSWLSEHHIDRKGQMGRLLQGTSPALYHQHVSDWLTFIEDTVRIGAWRAEPAHVKTWLDMRDTGAVRTRALRVSALRAFYTYAIHFGHTTANPADKRLSGHAHRAPTTPRLSPDQMELLRWGADQLTGAMAERNRLLMYFLLVGLRPRQIIEFELPGIIFEQHRMVGDVWQKGGGTRTMAFPDEVRAAVRAYLPTRSWRPPGSYEERGPLLVTRTGNRLDSNYTPRSILHTAIAHALRHPEPNTPELPGRITPDMVALSPSPFGELENVRRAT